MFGRSKWLPGGLGMILLAVWLILTGLAQASWVRFAHMDTVLAVLAIAAGVVILIQRR